MADGTELVPELAPELQVSQWLNSTHPLTLQQLRGQVVVLHAFQMLCPGCVAHGIPQALRIHEAFSDAGVVVIGLHTVFEHHAVMNAAALRVFLHEYRVPFAVAIDAPAETGAIPKTMMAYGFNGTPSLVLLDHLGRVRLHHFGQIDDLTLGALLGRLLAERDGGR
jgi:peroxiredoxin